MTSPNLIGSVVRATNRSKCLSAVRLPRRVVWRWFGIAFVVPRVPGGPGGGPENAATGIRTPKC